jgi:hypothetical protein
MLIKRLMAPFAKLGGVYAPWFEIYGAKREG